KAGSGGALGNVKDVKVIEMAGRVSDFRVLIDTCNTEISYAITGQSLATSEAEFGTRAQAEVHETSFGRMAKGDALALTGTLQQLIDWMVELNFGPDMTAPKGMFDLE